MWSPGARLSDFKLSDKQSFLIVTVWLISCLWLQCDECVDEKSHAVDEPCYVIGGRARFDFQTEKCGVCIVKRRTRVSPNL